MIYLDYNATAPMRPQVSECMTGLLSEPLNPSSAHASGRKAKQIIEASRKVIAEAVNCFPGNIVFCSSGTEANNWALRQAEKVLVSAIEHSSVLSIPQTCHASESWHPVITVTQDGVIDLSELDASFRWHDKKVIVSVMLANNETGVIQPIREVMEIAKKYNALVHCDAVQALGKIPLDFTSLGVDLMTVSAHKMGGPVGAAALIIRNGLPIEPFLTGGGQESRRRAGTENVPAIAGFAKAVEQIDLKYMEQLRNWMNEAEQEIERSGGHIIAQKSLRLPNTSCIVMPGVASETQLMSFDLEKIALSAGSACSSGRIEPSHVLKAMGIPENEAGCAVRVSGGWATTQADINAFVTAWKTLYGRLANKAA